MLKLIKQQGKAISHRDTTNDIDIQHICNYMYPQLPRKRTFLQTNQTVKKFISFSIPFGSLIHFYHDKIPKQRSYI